MWSGASGGGARVLEWLHRDKGRPFEWLRRSSRGIPVFWSGAEALTHRRKLQLLSPRLRESFANRWSWEEILPLWNEYRSRVDRLQPLQWMGYVDLRLRLPELLLMRVDKMSMATSVEARVPFLDHQLVEVAMRIPDAVKVPGYRPKALLKEAVRGLIPDAIIDRRKQGFGVPVSEWFGDQLGGFTKRAVSRLCKDSDLLDRGAAAAAVSAGDSSQSWILCNLALWHATFIQREPEALIES